MKSVKLINSVILMNSGKITVINFSNEKFEFVRKYNSKTAYELGLADNVIEYSPKSIDKEFYNKNIDFFSIDRGAGLWLWKPYIIYKTLKKMDDGDYLFYCDAGNYFVSPIKSLVSSLEKSGQDIMAFELPLLERQWTKQETFTALNYRNFSNNQILATYILVKNTTFSRAFIKEWLNYMQDKRCSFPTCITDEPNSDDFIEHREDQSVFSILCRKHRITPFRDPSQFGERPYEYAWRKSYSSKWKRYSYNPKKYKNSNYPQIIVTTRGADLRMMKKREFIMSILAKIGIVNKCTYKLRYHTSY